MKAYTVVTSFAVAGLVGLAACATPGENGPAAIMAPTSASRLAVGDLTNNTPELGVLKVCKTGNAGGQFTLAREQHGDGTLLGYIFGIIAPTFSLDVNVCKEKKLTNIRAAGRDENIIISTPRKLTIESALDHIDADELVELTPDAIRLRKRVLDKRTRPRRNHG